MRGCLTSVGLNTSGEPDVGMAAEGMYENENKINFMRGEKAQDIWLKVCGMSRQDHRLLYFLNLNFSQTGSIMRKKCKRDGHGLHQRKRSCGKIGHHKPNGQLSLRSRTNRRCAEDR